MADQLTGGDLTLITPGGWIEVDLDPDTRRQSIARLVAQGARGAPGGDAFALELARFLEQQVAEARTHGAVRASVFAKVLGGELVCASLVVSLVEGQAGAEPSEAGPAALAQGLTEVMRSEGATEMRSLPAGPAVRLRRRQSAPTANGQEVPVESVQYLVALPAGDRLVLLSFSTPCLGLAEAFVELFDTIAETLVLRPAGSRP